MIDFNPEFGISELSQKIGEGYFDNDIKEHFEELLSERKELENPCEFFSMTIARDDGSFCYLSPGEPEPTKGLTGKERTLLSLFEIRVNKIYGDLTGKPEPDYSVAFADAYAHGKAEIGDVDKYAQYFYKVHSATESLQSFLGLTDNELLLWMKKDTGALQKALDTKKQPAVQSKDLTKSVIRFYDSKTQSRRLLMVAGTTDNNEFLCFQLTTAGHADADERSELILVPKSSENGLRYDSFVKCDVAYIIATDSIYTEHQKTSIRLSDGDLNRILQRHELMKVQNKVTRIFNTVEPKKAEFEKLKEQVIKSIEDYKRDPKLMAELIDFRAKFYDYSLNNTMLIMLQNRGATFVSSFSKWKNLGYSVNKGEKSIKILVPYEVVYFEKNGHYENVRNASRSELDRIYKGEIPTVKKTFFTTGHVFDISQTNCPTLDYPKIYDMGYESAGHAALYEGIKEFAEKSGFTVIEDTVSSIALKGFYRPADDSITINCKLNDSEKLATITHEFAHALMHKTSTQPLEVTEFEAECLSHMIQRRFGLPVSDMNKDYLSIYYSKVKADTVELDKSFSRISKAYKHVTTGFDKGLIAKGFAIAEERGVTKAQSKAPQPVERVTQNFLRDLE